MSKANRVQLMSGERLETDGDDERGVITDAGIIPWAQVAGWWCWHEQKRRWFFVPVT